MDHDDAFPKFDEVPEGEGEPPGELLDAGEGLDSWVSPANALLLSLKTHKQLRKVEENTSAACRCQCVAEAYFFRMRPGQRYLLQTEHQ